MLMESPKMPNEPHQYVVRSGDSLAADLRVFQSGDLFGPAKEIGISHDGALYRLRVTRTGKLILTK
jgi:hemin uptake protein HemP